MTAPSKIAALHGALWNIDPWYRRCCYAGPLSMALLICGWIAAQPQQPARSAGIPWAVPLSSGRPATIARPAAIGQNLLPPDVAKRFSPPGWKPPGKPAGDDKPPAAAAAQPPAPVLASARKAALYEDDAADANGIRSDGTVIWRTEESAGAADQPKELAIRAEIELPGRGIKMTLSIRRNTDPSLSASHVVELAVTLPPDFTGGGIASVQGISVKPNERAKGIPIFATAVKVSEGLFLIGLPNNDGERWRNRHLLEENGWIDIAVVYANQRRAIVALEKGDVGYRVFNQAFMAWLR